MPHRFFLTRLLVLVSLAGLVAGCGSGAATGDLDKIQVAMSRFEITVTNASGSTLMDVVAEIVPAGPGSHFVTRIGRMSSGEKRSLAHTSFSDRDSVPFGVRTAKPRRVIVSGQLVDGRTLRVELPFKQE